MLNRMPILALFKDIDDEALCTPLLTGIPGVIRSLAGSNLSLTLENLKRTGSVPALTIVTSRLYPGDRPALVATIRAVFPATEFLLVSLSNDPFPPLKPLAADRVRHLTINPASFDSRRGIEARAQFLTAVSNLVDRRSWKIADYVKPGSLIHEFSVTSSAQKEELIARIERLIDGNLPDIGLLRQKGALLADEMLENAMYGAPRGADGSKLYRKGEVREVQSGERIIFRCCFDGETLAMEVVDGWGSLSPDLVLEYLARKQEGQGDFDEIGGRGLFIIWRFLDQFHVSIRPGVQTVVGGLVRADSPYDPETPKGFHISSHC